MSNMYQSRIDEKKQLLKTMQKKLLDMNHDKKMIEANLSNLNKKKHLFKLIKAGKVIERAGILNDYDEDKLYQVLIDNQTFLFRK